MYKVKFTHIFKKKYKQLSKTKQDISVLDKVIEDLKNGKKLDEKYKDHQLLGKFKTFRECHIKPDWLLIYRIQNNILTLTLVDTGSHAEILRM